MKNEPVKPVLIDCRTCGGKWHSPGDQYTTCPSCCGQGCRVADPWPAGKGVFFK